VSGATDRRAAALPPPVADVRRSVLPNGARVLTDVVGSSSSATIGIWVGVGGRDEPDRLAGASHFLEHLVFKGSHRRSALEVALEMDGIGGEMNAYTASEYTAYYARVPAPELEFATELLLDVVHEPALRPEEFDAEREVILEELAAADDDPEDVVGVRLFEAMFPEHALGREVLGSQVSIGALGRDDVAAFLDEWYCPANVVVTGAGKVDHDRLVAQVEAAIGHREQGHAPSRGAPPTPVEATVCSHDPGDLVHVALGWRSAGVHDVDRFALAILNHVLGAGPSSRLFQRVREERGLTYSISSGVSQFSDAGALTASCAVTPAKAATLLDVVDGEVAALVEHGISDEELARSKRSMRGSMLLGLEDSGTRSSRLGLSETVRGQVTPIEQHLARLDAVELDDVARVAVSVLGGPRVTSLVGPGDLEALADRPG
jgi:predicted Zn-dependent peptidase